MRNSFYRIAFLLFMLFLNLSSTVGQTKGVTYAGGLFCKNLIFDAGILSETNGKFSLEHVFTLENKSGKAIRIIAVQASCPCLSVVVTNRVADPGGIIEVKASMDLPKGSLDGRLSKIVLKTDEENMPPLVLAVLAKAGLSSFVTPELIDFGDVYPGFERKQGVYVCMSSKVSSNCFIKSINLKYPNIFTVNVDSQKRIKKFDENGNEFYFYVAKLDITLRDASSELLDKESVVVELTNGDLLKLKTSWNVRVFPTFIPAVGCFYSDDLQNTKTVLQIQYNSFTAGEPDSVRTTGAGLSVKESINMHPLYIYKIEYDSTKDNKLAGNGEFIVTTKLGKENRMNIIKKNNHYFFKIVSESTSL